MQTPPTKNRILAALPKEEYERLLPSLKTVFLETKQVLYTPNEPIQHLYFPLNSVGSLIATMENGESVEVATVGNEGIIGLAVFLGADSIPILAFSQVPGEAMRMTTDAFKNLVTPSSPLHKLLQLYTQALFNQTAQSTACNRLHSIEERCCRWLLMTHDRAGSDEFSLTQEFLAQMLGVRRASVNIVASTLQKAGFIRYARGKITILDRPQMEATVCECYAIVKAEYDRLLG